MRVKNNDKILIEKNKVLDAALKCFVEKGYAYTSVDDIVKAYGKSKGSVYYYFKSKEQIFKALFIRQYEEENQCLQDKKIETDNLIDFIHTAINGAYNFINDHFNFITVSIECWSISLHDEVMNKILKDKQERIIKIFETVKKHFKKKNDFEEFYSLFISLIDGFIIQAMLKKQEFPANLKKIMADALIGFLKTRNIICEGDK